MRKTVISAAALLISAAAIAQNLNPTVEVTNAYSREAGGIEKPSQLLSVPDSLYHFNLDFDYSVKETPYQGAYEFKPYLVQPRPAARLTGEGRLYLRGGLGYTFHPELTAIWTPLQTKNFRLGVFGDHHSYIGRYHTIALDADNRFTPDGTAWKGKDMRSTIGADALYSWQGGFATADLRYQNIVATHVSMGDFVNNKVQFKARVGSDALAPVPYEVSTRLSWLNVGGNKEFHTVTEGFLGTKMKEYNLRINAGVETLSAVDQSLALISAAPRFLITMERLDVEIGARLAFLFRSDGNFYRTSSGTFFPDIRLRFSIIPDKLVLKASVTGRDRLLVYSDLIDRNPFLPYKTDYMDNSVERINAAVSLGGQVASRFHYGLRGGYILATHALLPGYRAGEPYFGFVKDLRQLYGTATMGWTSAPFDADAAVTFRYSAAGDALADDTLFLPAAFEGKFSAFYKWGDRLKAGATVDAVTKRVAPAAVLPGYVDVGLQADFRQSRNLGLWLRVGNLLCQPIQRNAFYAEKGLCFTVGATWQM
ncbi:MAG: hypothetical protein IK008_03100 [Bacteroidales bacterium]|nr:hypothetical protein [Bacteroidales bacterium]